MAGNSKFRVRLETELDIEKGLADAQAKARDKTITVNLKFNESDIQQRFEEIRNGVDSMASMTVKKNVAGVIDQYTLNYVDQYKNKYTEVWRLAEQVDLTTGKTETKWVSTSKVLDGVGARQKELNNALQKANEFLEKSNNMAKTPAVNAAIAKAQEIKVAVSEGDVAKVAQLNSELKQMRAGLSGTKVGLQSWTESLGRAIKQTVSYSVSVGLVYGALNQLRQGFQYIVDLNKEMTNIQVVTGNTDAEIERLASGYNDLAEEMSVSTLEIAKGERIFSNALLKSL